MSCKQCQELCVKYVIREPEQLRSAIRIAERALNEEILVETKSADDWNQYSFRECAEKMIWGDIVDYQYVSIAELSSYWPLKPIMAVVVIGRPRMKSHRL